MLPVAGVPILRRAITSLLRCGFDQFVIGTGYLEHVIRTAVATWFPDLDVTFVTNDQFATTQNAYSLRLCRSHVDRRGFILVDGDVVFDESVLEQLIERGPDCLAVRSVGELGLEEVKVIADRHDRVLQIGKHVGLHAAMGESVGIQLFSAGSSRRLFEILDHRRDLAHEYYEAAFQQLIDEGSELYGIDIGSRYATEIDTIDDLLLADAHLATRPPFDLSTREIKLAV